MPIYTSTKYKRDLKTFEFWAELSDTVFQGIGTTRDGLVELQKQTRGQVVVPTARSYQTDRTLKNPIFNHYPRAIVFCESEMDVAVSMAFAQTIGDGTFQIRAGGHCTAGFSSGSGLLIDVKALKNLWIAPDGKTANVGPGVEFGDFNAALAARGLHVPAGECESVCVGGYVQGGGYGFTSVTFGMNCDNVRSMRVMLPDGQIVTASASVNPDLFWALRGGTGGNFGVVLNVEYDLVPLGQCIGFAVTFPLTDAVAIQKAADAMTFLQRDYMGTTKFDPYMNLQASLCYQSQVDAHGQPIANGPVLPYLMIRGLWAGDLQSGEAAISPIMTLPGGIPQWTKTADFNTLNQKLLSEPQGMPFLPEDPGPLMPYEDKTSRYIQVELTAKEWISVFNYYCSAPTNRVYGYFEFYGGKIAQGPAVRNCFVHREALYNLTMDIYWLDPNERRTLEDWLFGWKALLEPFWNGGIYQNYPNITAPNYPLNYWGDARFALAHVKQKYDPNNIFRFRQQVLAPVNLDDKSHIDAELLGWIETPIQYDPQF